MAPDPDRLPAWRRYLTFWGANVAADVNDEIAFHIEQLVAVYVAQGVPIDEARRVAIERFGNPTDIARAMRELAIHRETTMRRTEWRDALTRDLRYAVRQLAKRRGFTLVALVSLALGIGANTAIFSAVNAVLLHPVATHDLDRIMVVRTNYPTMNLMSFEVGPGEALDILARNDLFDAAGAWAGRDPVLTNMGEPRRLTAVATMGRFFDVFGVVPALGRLYRADESGLDQFRIAVLSYSLWQQLGADRSILGKKITLSGTAFEVVGVAPPSFDYPQGTELYYPNPIGPKTAQNRGQLIWSAVGRIKTGVTREQFDAGIRSEQKRWHDNPAWSFYRESKQFLSVVPLTTMIAGQLRPVLLVLLGAVGFVLLIACANIASLQLVHGTARAKELAVRAALGASRGTIAGQLLVENLLLSLGGGVLGVALGLLMLAALSRVGAAQMPALENVHLSPAVLALAACATIAAGLAFGLVPALRGARVDLNTTLKDSARGSLGADKNRLLRVGVVAQVALTMMLLLGSGLLIRSLQRLLDQNPGFNAEHVVTFRTTIQDPAYRQPGATTAFYNELVRRLRPAPGVSSVGLVSELPFSKVTDSSPFTIVGRAVDPNGPALHANLHWVNAGYFTTMSIPLVRGRLFDATDVKGAPNVVIIDSQLAKQFFPNEDPIGKRINQDATIVGIVGTVSQEALGEPPKATIYYSSGQADFISTYFVTVRSALPAASIAGTVRAVVASIDRNVPVFAVHTLDELVGASLAPRRLAMTVLTALAALSLMLAIFGLYGVISYAVSQRTTEFGIRAALGAEPWHLRGLVVRQGLTLALAGVVFGLAIAWVATRSLSALLFGVSPHDPFTFALAALLVSATAAAASFVPARRATAIPLTEALRAS